jgi:hypothetical protein
LHESCAISKEDAQAVRARSGGVDRADLSAKMTTSLLRAAPGPKPKIFNKIEDFPLTVIRNRLICSSRDAGSGSKSDVLPGSWSSRFVSVK